MEGNVLATPWVHISLQMGSCIKLLVWIYHNKWDNKKKKRYLLEVAMVLMFSRNVAKHYWEDVSYNCMPYK